MRQQPIVNAPTSVIVVLALLALVHIGRGVLSEFDDAYLVLVLAFIPARYDVGGSALPGGEVAAATSFVTHMLVHGDAFHLIVNSVWLLAFGTPIARRIGGIRFLLFSVLCGVAGAATFLMVNPGLEAPMIGASGAVSGLTGGLMRFLFAAIDRGGTGLLQAGARGVPRMDLGAMLHDRRVLLTIGIWVALNFLFSMGLGDIAEAGSIAWEAHIGGFFFGLLAFAAFDPSSGDDEAPLHPVG